MNPLTLVKRIQNINSKEAALGISEQASWHVKYKESAYVYVGGIPFDLTEGDLLAVFAQYGEIVDVNLVRDKGTGKSKGFAFIAYEDQRSTNLAVDNLNGAQILGRIVRVDHVSNYKKKEEENEEAEQQKREARGVCRAFQRGDCTRGAGCKFSHNEQRAANTGWGAEDHRGSSWGHDKFDGSTRTEKRPIQSNRVQGPAGEERSRLSDKETRGSRIKDDERGKQSSRDEDNRGFEKRVLEKKERETNKENQDRRGSEMRSRPRDDNERRDDKRSRRKESEPYPRVEREKNSSSYRRSGTDEENRHRSRDRKMF
ncbi:hypothetical protein LguiA_011982 [Lonicera macranthoides]